jgi:hypothetical protein
MSLSVRMPVDAEHDSPYPSGRRSRRTLKEAS